MVRWREDWRFQGSRGRWLAGSGAPKARQGRRVKRVSATRRVHLSSGCKVWKVPAGRRVGGSRFLSLPAAPPLATHWLQGCCPADAAAAAAADGGGTPAVRSARGGGPAAVGSARPEWTSRLIQRPAHCPHGTVSGGRRGGTKTPYWRYLRGRMPSLRRVDSRRRVRDGLANWGSVARQDRDHRIAARKGRRRRDFFVVVKPRDSVPCHGPAAGLPVGCRSGDGPLSWVPRPGSWSGLWLGGATHLARRFLSQTSAGTPAGTPAGTRARTNGRTHIRIWGGRHPHTVAHTSPPVVSSAPCHAILSQPASIPMPCHAIPAGTSGRRAAPTKNPRQS